MGGNDTFPADIAMLKFVVKLLHRVIVLAEGKNCAEQVRGFRKPIRGILAGLLTQFGCWLQDSVFSGSSDATGHERVGCVGLARPGAGGASQNLYGRVTVWCVGSDHC